MKVERIERSKHKQERVLVYLEGGNLLRITESELLRFGLYVGLDISPETVVQLQKSGARSETRVRAANMISARPLSKRELTRGPARIRDELYRRGVPRELWDEALETAPDAQETLACVIASKTRGKPLNEKDYKRLSDALLRRGFSWGEVKTALRTAGAALTDADDGL